MTTIIFDQKGLDIEVKRFNVNGQFDVICPSCGENININLEDQYLSYPVAGKFEAGYGYCESCDTEHDDLFKIKADVIITVEA